jgi:hypothetical protein
MVGIPAAFAVDSQTRYERRVESGGIEFLSYVPITPVAFLTQQTAFPADYLSLSLSYSVRTPAGNQGSLWQHHSS